MTSMEDELLPLIGSRPRHWWHSANFLYALVFLQGVGVLFPWNSFITVTQYFADRLVGSSFEGNFNYYFTFAFQLTSLSCLALITRFFTNRSLLARIYGSLFLCLVVFLLTTILVKADMSPNSFFGVTLLIVILAGAASAFLQGGLFALCGMLQPRYTQALMSGQGLAGVTVSLLNIATLSVGNDSSFSALLFFSLAVAVVAVCIVGFYILLQSPLIKSCLETAGGLSRQNTTMTQQKASASLLEIFMAIKGMALPVMFTFLITLALFPTITGSIASNGSNEYATKYFVPVYCFLGFNVFDWVGRSCAFLQWPTSKQPGLIALSTLARLAFLPLFMLCNVQFVGAENYFPQVFTSDAWPYVFMVLFAFTNGYLSSLCMMYGPSYFPKNPESAASMMVWFLCMGLTLGTLFSFVLRAMMCHCNPFASSSDDSSTTFAPNTTQAASW